MDREIVIDSAPGKELLKEISRRSLAAFEKFYDLRKRWSGGYPLIHDGFLTYGFVDDLNLDWETQVGLIPTMAKIALEEEPEYFHCALSLLSALIPDDRILPRPDGFGQQLVLLKEKAEQFSFLPNLLSTWGGLVTKARCLKPSIPDPSYVSARELLIVDEAFLTFYPIPFPDLGDGAEKLCPVDHERIVAEGNETCTEGVDCIFECSAIVGQSQWWVFRCDPRVPDFIWVPYVCVRLAENRQITVRHWTQHSEPISSEDLHRQLLNLEFSPTEEDRPYFIL
jgi:hypothetical protein